MKTELEQWLESEIRYLEEKEIVTEEAGYLHALTNCLDFIQGAQVYLDWKANQEGNK